MPRARWTVTSANLWLDFVSRNVATSGRAVLPIIEAVAAVLEEFGDAFESQSCGVEGKELPVAPSRLGKEVAVLLAVGSADGLAVPVGVPRVNFLQGEHVVAAQFCEFFGDGRRVAAVTFDVPAHHAERFCTCGLETRAEAAITRMADVFMGGSSGGMEARS